MCPFKLPDHDALVLNPPQTSPAGSPLSLFYAVDDPQPLRDQLQDLMAPINDAREAEETAALTTFDADPGVKLIRSAGVALRGISMEYNATKIQIQKDGRYTNEGKRGAVTAAAAKRDAAREQMAEAVLGRTGDAVLRRFPPMPNLILPPDLAPMAGLILSSASQVLPGTLLGNAIQTLREAVDAATPAARAFQLNQLLIAAYLPTVARYGQSPPKFWGGWASLAADLADLAQRHIRTVFQVGRSTMAAAFVHQARTDFAWLCASVDQNNDAWDPNFETACSSVFTWSAERAE